MYYARVRYLLDWFTLISVYTNIVRKPQDNVTGNRNFGYSILENHNDSMNFCSIILFLKGVTANYGCSASGQTVMTEI